MKKRPFPSSTLAGRGTGLFPSLVLLTVIFLYGQKALASTSLVIAEVYGGGGNAGAAYQNDYVVIFNPGGSSQSVNGWSIQYQVAANSTWTAIPLPDASVAAGSYFLVRLSGGAIGAALPTPDATGSLNLNATQGKIALVSGATALSDQCPNDPSIIDKIGYGTTATVCNETTNATAPGNNANSMQRADGGCTDSDINSTDFAVATCNPRNSSSPANPCGGGTPPTIINEPTSLALSAGSTATFLVSAGGSGLSYSWRKNGGDISDLNASGMTTATLTITNAIAANDGYYQVNVTNISGATNSQVVTLTVNDPGIRTQPSTRTNVPGDTASFFVSAGGTPPLTYQWYFNGSGIFGATDSAYNRANVSAGDQGPYRVVVTNGVGLSVTSSAATLWVLSTPFTKIAAWDMDATNSFTAAAPAPSGGNGSAALVGGTTGTFAGGSFSDFNGPPGAANNGWNTAGYPASTANNKTAGTQFAVSTAGYQDILLTWEQRNSDTASKYARLQYSTDGVNFTDGPALMMYDTNNSFAFFYVNLAGVSAVNSNADFAFRIVSEFEATATGSGSASYVATVTSYGTTGTMRYDLVNVYGNAVITGPTLNASISGGDIVLTWNDNTYGLEAAPEVTGLYTNVPGAVSGYSFPLSGTEGYFRLAR